MRIIFPILTIVVIFIAILIGIFFSILPTSDSINITISENNSTVIINSTELITDSKKLNYSFSLPSVDKIECSINWTKYPIIGYHYLSHIEISEPTMVINHTFLYAIFKVEIKNPDNVLEIYKELSGLVKEYRTVLGINSNPKFYGEVNGNAVYFAEMLPYRTTIYCDDFYHPVNNLTWMKFDINEIE